MKILKNILLVIALLLVAMPCTHAADHHHGSPYSDQTDQFSAVHTCECHTCDADTVCTEPLEAEQELTLSSAVALQPPRVSPLFVLNQYRPAFRQVAPPVAGTLARLTTIQLLI
ncbi:hypothetical protein P4C99_04185 [Pontiellaceae bacterium B1224]|nr:hypothetical protein [Pontiellaceae bacterium B1224]